MSSIAQALRAYDTISGAQFPKSFGVTKREALLNMAKILEEAAEKPSRAKPTLVVPPAKAPDNFQITGITDAQDTDQTYEGHKVSDLRAAFEAVAPKDDWKGQIDAIIDTGMFEVTCVAVRFFTATELHIMNPSPCSAQVRVWADGYRAGPCGDR